MDAARILQDSQSIFGFCPCCGALFRLSETKLFHKAAPPHTAFDELDDERARVTRQEERLEAQIGRLQEEARQKGRKEMDRRLKGLTPFFRKLRIDLRDVKLLFNPVDYIAFRGLSRQSCTAVELLDREAASRERERLQRSIESTIVAGDVFWMTMRIEENGKVTCSR